MVRKYMKHDQISPIPAISVIMPVYNAEAYLTQSISTILAQTFRDFELLIIDDASTDKSLDICREFAKEDPRIHIYKQKKSGPGIARNFALSQARGTYIAFADADDFCELNMLDMLYHRAELYQTDIVFCDFFEFDEHRQQDNGVHWELRSEKMLKKHVFSSADFPDTLFQLDTTAVWNKLYRRSFVMKHHLQFSPLTRAEDCLFSLGAMAMAEKISYIGVPLIHYRQKENHCVSDHVNDVFVAYDNVHHYLLKTQKYDRLQKTFINHFLSSIFDFELAHLTFPDRNIVEQTVISYIRKYGIDKLPPDSFYYNHYHRVCHLMLKNKSFFEHPEAYDKHQKSVIPIVLAANNSYGCALIVTLQSLIRHVRKDRLLDIYVFYTNLSAFYLDILESMTNERICITCVDIASNVQKSHFDKYTGSMLSHLSVETYYRLLIPQYISRYDKILYLDSDLIIKKDIAELYDIDLQDNLLAGVVDILLPNEAQERLSWGYDPLGHINAGVLLINLKQWQQEDKHKACMKTLAAYNSKLSLADQDILNIVGQNRILYLDYKWNFYYTAWKYKREAYQELCGPLDLQKGYIIHYNGAEKPWLSLNVPDVLSNLWWNYARDSLIYEYILCHCVQKIQPQITSVSSSQCVLTEPARPLTRKEIWQSDEKLIPDMISYIKQAVRYCFCLGNNRKKNKIRSEIIYNNIRNTIQNGQP